MNQRVNSSSGRSCFRSTRFPLAAAVSLYAVIAILPARAESGPPFITDDTDTPEYRHWEINLAFTYERRGSEHTFEAPLIDLNYGLLANTELKVEVPFIAQKDEADRAEALGDILMGAKWRFYELGDEASAKKDAALDAMSVYPQVGLPSPNSSAARREFVSVHPVFILPVEQSAHWREWHLDTEFGWVMQGNEPTRFFAGAVVSHSFGAHNAGLELYSVNPTHTRSTVLVANLGGRVRLTNAYAVLVSVGREWVNHTERRASFISYVGLQMDF
jgi:hypothetical protein